MSEESSFCKKVMKTLNNSTYFSDDIWHQIFPYFPLSAIFKFKCVSQVWNCHLSSPNFIHRWIQFNTNIDPTVTLPWILVYTFKPKVMREFSLAYPYSHSQLISNHNGFSFAFLPNSHICSTYHTLYFLRSSNGLVLCLRNTFHYVCNPLSQKWVQLPPTPHQNESQRLSTFTGFICDCFTSPNTSYKVVRLPSWHGDSNRFNIQVFSSDLGKWNLYEVLCPDGVNLSFPRGAFGWDPKDGMIIHNNMLYWIDGYNRIVAYNLENNESEFRQCKLLSLPYMEIDSHLYLGESNGSIFCAQVNASQETLCVWVLQEENFHLLHIDIDLHDLFAQMAVKVSANLWFPSPKIYGFNPVNSNVVMIGYKHYIWAYNTETRNYDELCHPSFLGNKHSTSDINYLPLVLKVMPTMLPPQSW